MIKNQKTILKNLIHLISFKLKHFWIRWAIYEKKGNEIYLSSADTTLDISNFIVPYNKTEKLKAIVYELINVFEHRKNLPNLILGVWVQNSCKRSMTASKLRMIMLAKAKMRDAMKHALTAFALACRFQVEFTDIN